MKIIFKFAAFVALLFGSIKVGTEAATSAASQTTVIEAPADNTVDIETSEQVSQ